ncbi:MAG: hypothetical protein V7635_2759, partial [Arthrobacter sp.]
ITEECLEFNKQAMDQVLEMKPDLVLTISTRTSADPGVPEVLEDSWVDQARQLNDAGIAVVGVRETPRMPQHVPSCLAEHPEDPGACSGSVMDTFGPAVATDGLDAQLPDTHFLDLTRYFCVADVCPAIIGNVIVYKDENHVTRSYLMTVAPYFEKDFLAITGWDL